MSPNRSNPKSCRDPLQIGPSAAGNSQPSGRAQQPSGHTQLARSVPLTGLHLGSVSASPKVSAGSAAFIVMLPMHLVSAPVSTLLPACCALLFVNLAHLVMGCYFCTQRAIIYEAQGLYLYQTLVQPT